MERFVDAHCHILPEVDDGAHDIEETRKMLETAYAEGIHYIIATPHHHPYRGRKSPGALRRQLRLVREEAEKISGRLRVYLGTEICFGQDIPDKLKEEKILTMNRTRYVLVEFSPTDPFDQICRGIQQLQMKGYEVILAHVERYRYVTESIERAEHLADMGVRLQVNADSITGKSGRRIKKYIKDLMERRLVFCVGTDAHNAGSRAHHMMKSAQYVKKKYAEEYMKMIFFSNAMIMLRRKRKEENESGQINP